MNPACDAIVPMREPMICGRTATAKIMPGDFHLCAAHEAMFCSGAMVMR